MKREAIMDFFIYNGRTYSTSEQGLIDRLSYPMLYEVIRLIDGVPLYLENHLERLRGSVKRLGHTIQKTNEEITSEIMLLAEINRCGNLNVKLLCSNLEEKEQSFLTFFIESNYPKEASYAKGIDVILYYSERANPNVKTVNNQLRENVNKAIAAAGAYEGLLVNREGYITEGSRSNVFFVKGEKVFTAPQEDVLMGVTRMKIMGVCNALNIEVIEKAIHEEQLRDMDGAFITGTSVNVLPISGIQSIVLDSVNNAIIKRISTGYLEDMKTYLGRRRC